MAHIVHCRACGGAFNRDLLIEGVDWVKPSTNQYYHKKCYDQWSNRQGKLGSTLTDEQWFEALKYYLNHIVKMPIDYKKLNSQWNNLLKQGRHAKGIYFAMRYFYDVINGDKNKAQGGIGIVSFIYQDSKDYWQARFERDQTIIQKIEDQVREQMAQRVSVKVQTQKPTNKRKTISLDEIE